MIMVHVIFWSGFLLWEKSQWEFNLQDATDIETESCFFLVGVDLYGLCTIFVSFIFDFLEGCVKHEIPQMSVNHA